MTEEELIAKREEFKSNEMFQQSASLHKDFQLEQFHINGTIIEGRRCKVENIDGQNVPIIYNFKNGLIHSNNDEPAIEYPMHWEYWENGLIQKVIADGGDTEEFWENGVPVRIERNLAARRNSGEQI